MGEKIVTGKPKCVRCHNTIHNPFTKTPWCGVCTTALEDMTFNGVEVLKMVLEMMPPRPLTPEQQIKITVVQNVCIKVLNERGILLPHKEETDKKKPSSILLK